MSDIQDSQQGAVNQTAPPETTETAVPPPPEKPALTPEQEVEEARQQVVTAQQQLEAAQNRLRNAQAAVKGSAIQPLMQTEPAKDHAVPEADTPQASAPEEDAVPATQSPKAPVAPQNFGFCNGLFIGLEKIAPFAILAIMACMAWPVFLSPDKSVFCPAEVNTLTAFLHSLATNSWFTATGLENGAFTQAQWPGFMWYLGLFTLIPGLVKTGLLLPIAAFTATFLAVLGVWSLCLAARFGSKAAFAASVILLCAPLFAPMPDFVGPAALAAALMLFAMAFFCHGWLYPTAWFSVPVAFILTTLAGLTGGLLPFATPLVASVIFLIWRGAPGRARSFDALFGLLLMLALLGCWYGAMHMAKVPDGYLHSLFAQSMQFAWPVPLKWFVPIIAGILGLMPWLLMLFGVSWFRVLAKAGATLGASRRSNGAAFVWVSAATALVISLFVSPFHPAAIAIACIGAALLGKAYANLPGGGNRLFYLLAGICLILGGIAILSLTFGQTQQLILQHLPVKPPIPDLAANLQTFTGLKIMAAILIVGGLLSFIFVRKYKGYGGLILGILIVIAMCQPARCILVPELTNINGTPLVAYSAIEDQVNKALAPAPAEAAPKAPAKAAPQAPEPAAPAAEAAPAAPAEPAAPPTPEAAPAEAPAQPATEPAPAEAAAPQQ